MSDELRTLLARIAALEHDVEALLRFICGECGSRAVSFRPRDPIHAEYIETIPATEIGYHTYTCGDCGYVRRVRPK